MDMEEVIKKHVLRFVPAKSLCRFKSVSKGWNQWISSPFFAHQQAIHFSKTSGFFSQSNAQQDPFFIPLDHASHGIPSPSLSFFFEPTTIRSTSNGLICSQSAFPDNIYFICNPTTREWRELPQPTLFHNPASAVALAFTPSTFNFESHFQLVCAVPFHSVKAVSFEIYSSRTNSWRLAESQYYYASDGDLTFQGDGFSMDGSVYWEASNGVVLGFDLRYEEHGEIPLPRPVGRGALAEICGELSYVMVMTCNNNEDDEADADDYYSLGVYGGHDMVIKRRIPLDLGDLGEDFDGEVRVLSCLSDGLVMILVGSSVILYDVEKRMRKLVRKLGPSDRVEWFLPYVNSLVRVCPIENMPPEDRQFDEILRNMSVVGWDGDVMW